MDVFTDTSGRNKKGRLKAAFFLAEHSVLKQMHQVRKTTNTCSNSEII